MASICANTPAQFRPSARQQLTQQKIRLSSEESASFNSELPNGDRYQREIPRNVFEVLIEPVLNRTVAPCKLALTDAGVTPEQIDQVVLVGGSTRIPVVRQLVDDLFRLSARCKKPHTDLNPDEVVAMGAAVQAGILAGASKTTDDMLLLDVTPLSLGIEALGGVTAKIIQRNSTIPASRLEQLQPPALTARRTWQFTLCKASASLRCTVVRWPDSI